MCGVEWLLSLFDLIYWRNKWSLYCDVQSNHQTFIPLFFLLLLWLCPTYCLPAYCRRDQSGVPGVLSSLLQGGCDVNCRTSTLGVTPLTLLLRRAALSSKSSSTKDGGKGKGKEKERGGGGGQRGRGMGMGVDGLYSPGSKGTTLDSLTPFLDHTQLAILSSDTDDRTTLYGNHAPNGIKCSPKGSTHSQLDSYSVSVDDHQSKGGEAGAGEGGGEDSWVDESYMTWTNTAMHLIQSGDYLLNAPINPFLHSNPFKLPCSSLLFIFHFLHLIRLSIHPPLLLFSLHSFCHSTSTCLLEHYPNLIQGYIFLNDILTHLSNSTSTSTSIFTLTLTLTLPSTGAQWDVEWRHKGQTQLHLLISSFSPSPIQKYMDAFCFTLSSALSAGHNPALQDRKGRNALFIMCERLSLFSAGERTASHNVLFRWIFCYSFRFFITRRVNIRIAVSSCSQWSLVEHVLELSRVLIFPYPFTLWYLLFIIHNL